MKRVSFFTLGCKLNYAETSTLERQFVERGFSVVPFTEKADVCILNTCTVTGRADREARQIVRRALRTSPEAFVAVIGCYAQLDPEVIASIEGVDMVLGASEKFQFFSYAGDFTKTDAPRICVSPIGEANDFGPAFSAETSARTRAFLKIQDGCDYQCSFCTIPLARGSSRSQSIEECIRQASMLVDSGYREIILTGVNVGDYGRKDSSSLLALLREMENIDGLDRIRISSIEPNLLKDDLLSYWMGSEKICHHFHIPLQSGSDEILRSMRRRYATAEYQRLIETIKERDANAAIGADVIIGFPGETEEYFEKTFSYIHALPISYLHVFTYSERPNTPSMKMQWKIEPRIRYQHSERLRQLGVMKKSEFYRSQLGQIRPVLIEATVDGNTISGYTDNYVRVSIPYESKLENSVAGVELTEQYDDGCRGIVRNVHTMASIEPPYNILV